MDPNVYAAAALPEEPPWPDASGPYLFLLEAVGSLELRILDGWIQRNRPPNIGPEDVRVALLPQTRRRRRRNFDPRIAAYLDGDVDPLLVPLRIAWLPPLRRGRRTAAFRDLLSLGDPRDPPPIRQTIVYRTRPDRCRIIAGTPSRASTVRTAWEDPEGRARRNGTSLPEFVAKRAWLTLERAERSLRGSHYKVPKFVRESLTESRSFVAGVARLADEADVSVRLMTARTRHYVREIAATHSPLTIDLVATTIRWLITKAYVGLHYDDEELAAIYTMGERYPLVFLPSHKSNFDHLVLRYVLYQNGLPPNHTAGGINMNFFPVGPILRRAGVFFIRREFKDDEPYKFALRQYLDYLVEKRFPLEWYMEGGRSRSGKLRPPRLGLLAYVVDSLQRGAADDIVIFPVSIAYDQIQDVGSYAAEQTGGGKERESVGWLLRVIRSLRLRYGDIHLRIGAPVSVRNFLAEQEDVPTDAEDTRSPAIPKLAFEVAVRINEVTPVTPISLVTLALLSVGDRSLTVDELMQVLEPFVDFVSRRDLPITDTLSLDDPADTLTALDALTLHGVVSSFEGPTDTVYRIGPEQHLAAAYYRNTIIHFFVDRAITELALLHARDEPGEATVRTVLDESLRLRDLLKFEFFFAPSDVFEDEIRRELADHDPGWRDHLNAGAVDAVLRAFRPYGSPAILRPFLEAYQAVGDIVARAAADDTLTAEDVRVEVMDLGKQYLLQGRIKHAESVTSVLFDSALRLAENRRLFDPGQPDLAARRLQFAAELHKVLRRLDGIEALAAAAAAGMLE